MPPNHVEPIKIGRQRGAALLIMIVIMVVGIAAMLISSLSTSALNNARQEKTSTALAQAKQALIGRAVSNDNRPGSLPCPDTNNDGSAEIFSGNHCPKYVGRLPWRTLGLPDLTDGYGERLWYALSPLVRDDNSAQPINSETLGQFNVSGAGSITNVVAIVFAPGPVLSVLNQSRDSANQNNISSYLESNNATNGSIIGTDVTNNTFSTATYTFSSNNANSTFNDQSLALTHDELFQPVEMRIAREVRNCLDEYAAASVSKYPWAAAVSDSTYTAAANTYFGRIPVLPNGGGSTQSQLDSTLNNAGNDVINKKDLLPSISNQMLYAGTWAIELTSGYHTMATVQIKFNDALVAAQALPASANKDTVLAALDTLQNALSSYAAGPGTGDATMQSTWTPLCTSLFSPAGYWSQWKSEVFYQVANGYQPGGSASCSLGNCITIVGVPGNFRAAVVVARNTLATQIPRQPFASSPNTYLESPNVHDATGSIKIFRTYSIDAPDPAFNDLALCLDGKVICK